MLAEKSRVCAASAAQVRYIFQSELALYMKLCECDGVMSSESLRYEIVKQEYIEMGVCVFMILKVSSRV